MGEEKIKNIKSRITTAFGLIIAGSGLLSLISNYLNYFVSVVIALIGLVIISVGVEEK